MELMVESLRADQGVSQSILKSLQKALGPQKFNAWFRHGTRLNLSDQHAELSVSNPFCANWIDSHYRSELSQAIQKHTKTEKSLSIVVETELSKEVAPKDFDKQAAIVEKARNGKTPQPAKHAGPALRHNLDDYVVGSSNRLAYSAAMSISGESKPAFNPLFIHGSCGVGKTHLLQGICNRVSRMFRQSRPFRWKYVTAEQFTNEFIQSLRNNKIADFRHRYRNLDLLAIDDVHFLAAKKATQDEFLHTFNAIESVGNRVVLASDTHPRLVGDLNSQLVSRFMSGMVVKIDHPDADTRRKILRQKAKKMNLDVPADLLEYLTCHIRGSVRELEGTLIKLTALCALENSPLTLDIARNVLADHLAKTDSAVTLGDIEAVTSAFFGITPADIHSSRRTKTVSAARMVTIFLARRHTQMSYPEIARAIGKNHSSAVLACKKLQDMINNQIPLQWTTPAGTKTMPVNDLLENLTKEIE